MFVTKDDFFSYILQGKNPSKVWILCTTQQGTYFLTTEAMATIERRGLKPVTQYLQNTMNNAPAAAWTAASVFAPPVYAPPPSIYTQSAPLPVQPQPQPQRTASASIHKAASRDYSSVPARATPPIVPSHGVEQIAMNFRPTAPSQFISPIPPQPMAPTQTIQSVASQLTASIKATTASIQTVPTPPPQFQVAAPSTPQTTKQPPPTTPQSADRNRLASDILRDLGARKRMREEAASRSDTKRLKLDSDVSMLHPVNFRLLSSDRLFRRVALQAPFHRTVMD